jgi:hypothetical protein
MKRGGKIFPDQIITKISQKRLALKVALNLISEAIRYIGKM